MYVPRYYITSTAAALAARTGEPAANDITEISMNNSGRITRTWTQTIEASADRVFPLLCPVREEEWLDGWRDHYELIYSESGLAEDGCVFRTMPPERPETIWMITKHDPVAKAVEFVRVTPGLVATRLNIDVEAVSTGSSRVHIRYTHTPISGTGAEFVSETHSEENFERDMLWWQDSMNHWLRTGETLRS
jgi:hypothetical protein